MLPQVSEITGLKIDDSIVVEEAALSKLIKSYCRESGVRNLRKHIEKIFRKAAFLNVSEGQTGITISKSNLQDFVGKPVFSQGMYNFGKGLKGGLISEVGSEICENILKIFFEKLLFSMLVKDKLE